MYGQTFSRKDPGCIVVLLDRSDSMRQPWQGSGFTLAEGAAAALNKILLDLCIKSTKTPGAPARHYFDVGVFGYGLRPVSGGEGVESAFGGQLRGQSIVPIPMVYNNPIAVREEPSVDAVSVNARVPIWVEAEHGCRTPMCEAIAVAGAAVFDWANAHPNSFPPIVINITDGLVTDSPYQGAGLAEWAYRLTTIGTNDGPTLLLNIFLSPTAAEKVLFPGIGSHLPAPGPEMFEISSLLPPTMVANARASQLPVADGARGLVFNADLASLVKFLEIGTRLGEIR